jgi:hypothetical protein
MRWVGHVTRMGKRRNSNSILIRKHEGERPLGRPRNSWEDSIKMDMIEIEFEDADWIHLV